MRRTTSTILAFLAASLVASIAVASLSAISKDSIIEGVEGAMIFSIVFIPYSVAAVTLIGFPLYLVARRYEAVNIWSASVSGLVGGIIVALVVYYPYPIEGSGIALFATAGLIAGFVFWVLWRLGDA
jgi:hypothetical protein